MQAGKEQLQKTYKRNRIHRVLAHSYAMYFILFLVGVTFDFIFRLKIFSGFVTVPAGVVLLMLGTLLVFWAQKTSHRLDKNTMSKETFCKGPYCYTRSPTHWGLFFLMLGFGIIANAVFVVLTTLLSFLISRFVFLDREERILVEKYGTPYLEYKKSVRL
jgi:protein-S-isoprenylcysteine O-methyltransferase Ste14